MSEPFDSPIEHAAAETVLPLPGSTLRAAREVNGYSLAEIAQALKFSVRQLEALENDDYSSLKGTTFIRGFVRSYARYLRLDEVPLLAALEPQVPVVIAEVRPVENMGAEMPVSGADGSKRVYGLAIAVLLLGGIAWFVWQERSVPASAPASQAAAPVVTGAATDEGAVSPALAPEPTKSAESAPAVTPPSPSIIPADAAPATNAPAAGEAGAAPTAANPNERQLLLAFSGVSWVEVRDASNRILYSGNSTPDSRQTVSGRPPFQLVIGNAQSVKLRYEDRTIDLQPYTRVDVARLTLDDNTK
jgi:cytoskeleton protein RodZ